MKKRGNGDQTEFLKIKNKNFGGQLHQSIKERSNT